MAYIEKSVEIGKPVAAVYQQWAECEDFPRFLEGLKEVGIPDAQLRWRAEVLTFAPRAGGTRVTLRIDYDAVGPEVHGALQIVSRRLQRDLDIFRSFAEGGRDGAPWNLLHAQRQPSHA